MAAASTATAAWTAAKGAFKASWGALKEAGGKTFDAGKEAAEGVRQSFTAADAHVVEAEGFGKALDGIWQKHPVTSVVAGTGLAAGTLYGGYKVVGHFTGREAARREAATGQRAERC